MYYAEQVIDGVLCSRTSPDDEFEPLTPIELTTRIIVLERKLKDLDKAEGME